MGRTIVRRVVCAAAMTVALTGSSMAAHATVHRSDHGEDVAQSVDSLVRMYDNECDGHWTRANYNTSVGSGGINNKSGCNTSAGLNASAVVTAVQACESQTLLPMSCSTWNNKY